MTNLIKLFALLTIIVFVSARSQYRVVNVDKNLSSVVLSLKYTGTDQYYGNAKSPMIQDLKFIFHVHAFYDFYFKIVDANNARY